nr:hypothetical protein [Tanacetum cinerariifolium]
MSRDVLTIDSTMRIPLLYRGEYSQWVERFMNYLEEQTDGKAMINSIKNGKSMWSDQEKRIQKIDRLARSLLIQGLPNDIYSLIDSNKTAKDLWDALARYMLGSEYDKQDMKAAVLYEYETFKATEGEFFFFFSSISVQTSSSGISYLLAVAFIFRQWEVPSGSGNFLTNISSSSLQYQCKLLAVASLIFWQWHSSSGSGKFLLAVGTF